MPVRNLIVGSDNANSLDGTSGSDLIYGFNPNGPQGNVTSITATRIASALNQPLFVAAPPGDFERLFIVEKVGDIQILDLGTQQRHATPFLDLSSTISTDGEGGLLGLAFDPHFAQNRFIYVNVTNVAGDTEIRRYQVSANDPNHVDPASSTLILSVNQPDGLTNHKGGWLGFGPDGFLYAALGDGGGGGDPLHSGQNIDSLLGKMLRLDVGSDAFPADPNKNYAIPADNMFVGTAGADEIYALGLRNPWRPSFDRAMGDFYIADVGQGQWEEINVGQGGANYGWNLREGPDEFSAGTPSAGTLTDPIFAYDHGVGQSITGGYVYRGESEGLQGDYFFADFVAGKIFTLNFDGSAWQATERTSQITTDAGAINNPASFGEDGLGNLYVVDLDGDIFRLTPNVTSLDQGDTLNGMAGDDVLFGGSGNDILHGGADNDWLYGGMGSDSLFGDDGRDTLAGGTGNDTLGGDADDDVLMGEGGNDHLIGGPGIDVAVYTEPSNAFAIRSFDGVIAVLSNGDSGRDRVDGVEKFTFADQTIEAGSVLSFQSFEYLASYADLIQALGANPQAGFDHYIDYGHAEGRPLDLFNGWDYLASYRDLIQAFGPSEAEASKHYVTYGFNEGRPVDLFDGWEYLASYVDLIEALGPDETAAAQHYVTYGFHEGRATALFDSLEYIASYPDLINALGSDATAGRIHYVTYGFHEGRDVDLFNTGQYLANYADLQAAFGDDPDAAAAHFIAYGYNEGRTDHALPGATPGVFTGNAGNNTMAVRSGDTVTGNGGNDTFVFKQPLAAAATITDFAQDVLQISADGFGEGLTPGATAPLVSAADLPSASHAGTSGYFIFDNSGADAGTVYWDATGGSGTDATAVVHLNNFTTLLSSDFQLV
jgi:glucose/arabinose dehydrogenase